MLMFCKAVMMHIVVFGYETVEYDIYLKNFRNLMGSSLSGWKDKMYAASISETSVIKRKVTERLLPHS